MRILHTMLRVGDLTRSVEFYTKVLGMKVLRQSEYPEGRFTLCFIGYGDEDKETVLELTHNWDTKSYDLGTGYGHIDTATVSQGQRVLAGDQIATMGNRGFSTGPHCHFEVWLNGTDKIDPVPWLATRGISLGAQRD